MSGYILDFVSRVVSLLPDSLKSSLYKMGPLSKFLRSSLNRIAPEGITTVSIASGYFEGICLSLNLKSEKDMWLGTYELELQQAIIMNVKPAMTAYDIGANIGYISLMLSKTVGDTGRVFAFEAVPENIERLRANLLLNEFASNVEVVSKAVVESEREVDFLLGPSTGMGKAKGSAGRENVEYDKVISVTGISLDEFVYKYGNPVPDVVKMDIEGGEVLALPGMQRVISEGRPLFFLEIHGPEAADVSWEFLSKTGYHFQQMGAGHQPVSSKDDLDWKSYILAVP